MAEQPTDLSSRQQELADLCLKLVSTLSFSEVCRLVVQAGVDLVQADRARIFLLGAEGFLRGGASAATPSMPALRPDGGPKGLRLGEGLSGRVAQTGLPIRVDDVREDPRWIPCDWTDRVGLGSYVGVPMRWGREMVGVFNCARVGRRPFTDADESVLSILAGYAAAAVQNARLHEEAAQSRDFFRSVVDDNADPIIITDFGGRIIRWNPSAGRMYGYSEEEVLGRHIDLLSSDPRGTQRFRSEVIERGEPVLFETSRRRKDGTEVPVSLTLSPVRQAEGRIVALVGVHRDIGERRRIEGERADHIVQLRRLQELSQKIGASLALDEVLQFVVESASEILRVPVVSLNLREGDMFPRRAEVNPFGPREYETRSTNQGATGRIAQTKEPLYIEDVQGSPLFRNKRWAERAGLRSYLGVPIKSGDAVIGVITCNAQGIRRFTENEIFLLTTLANSASIAIQNAERHQRLGEVLEQERRSEGERAAHIVQLGRLQELSRKINASLALDEVLQFVVESAGELLKVPVVSLNLREGDHFVRRAEVNPFGPRTYETRVAGQGVSGRVAATREPFYIENVQADPLYMNKAWAKQADVRSLLAVPILAGDEVIGVLNCVSKEVRKFTEDEAFLLTTLANSAAVAIQNAERHHRLEEALEQERRSERERAVHVVQLGRLQELSQKISASLDLDEVLQFVVESVSEILKVPAVSLNLREGGRFVRRAEVNPFGAREHETRAVGEGATGWIAERKEPLYIEDVQESPLFLNKRWAKRAGLDSYLGVPVMSAGEVSGVLVCNAKGCREFTENEVFLLTTLASSASIAIQNAERHRRLEEGLEQERRSERERAAHIVQLGRLQALSQKISASLDLDEVLQFVVESAVEILQAPYSALNLREGGRFVVRAAVNPFPGPRGFETRTAGQGAAGWVAEKKQNLYIEDVRESSLYRNREWAQQAGLGSFLGVPLMVGGEVIGILNCLTQGVRKFSENEVFLLTTLANSASIAIQNAERHRQLEEALEQVQRSQELTRRAERLSALAMLSEGAAHELLNPANIIGLYAQRMEWENEEGSPGRKTAEVILRNVKRITRICDALRQFSQDKPPGQELLDPNALVGEVVRPLEPELRLHSIDDEAALGKVSKRVLGDPAELRQALFHLVRNAMDAMPRGGKLKVATREVEEEGRLWWEARVSDTGEGILPENLSRIFDPFFTTKPPDKATGLGLSVTHGIVERHGGKLWAESAPGTGATFILRLPAVREG